MKGLYLGLHEGSRWEILYASKFDENTDLGSTYLGRVDMTRSDRIEAAEKFPILEQPYMVGKLSDGKNVKYI